MYYIYCLRSIKTRHFYTGQTDNIEQRLEMHNSGRVTSTKRYAPWRLMYKESFNSRNESVEREKYLKSHAGRRWLKKNFEKLGS